MTAPRVYVLVGEDDQTELVEISEPCCPVHAVAHEHGPCCQDEPLEGGAG